MIKKIAKVLKKPEIILLKILSSNICNIIPDELYLRIKFRVKLGEKLNLNNPKTFNEKLQWLKLNDRKDIYTNLVDKYEVRKFIKEKIGEEYLIPLIGVWDKIEDIDLNRLPNEFVLKCTHDSGGVIICKNKDLLDTKNIYDKLSKHIDKNFYYLGREWPYKNVKPRIICEKYMRDDREKDLKDYKFLCFNGKVKCSFVCLNRNSEMGLNVDFYDRDWNKMPFERYYPNSKEEIKKPIQYAKMIELAEELAKDIPFLRVDFYEVNGKIYFGELTFYPGSGFEWFKPKEYDYLLGRWIELKI